MHSSFLPRQRTCHGQDDLAERPEHPVKKEALTLTHGIGVQCKCLLAGNMHRHDAL